MTKQTWLQEYLDAWNARDAKRVADWMADDATYEDVALGQTHKGREAIFAFVAGMPAFSSDYRFDLVIEFSTDSNYGAEWELHGTHDGDGSAGPPATGKPFRIRGVSMDRFRVARSSTTGIIGTWPTSWSRSGSCLRPARVSARPSNDPSHPDGWLDL